MIDFTVGEESLIADPGVEIILKGGAKEEVQKHRIVWTYRPTPPVTVWVRRSHRTRLQTCLFKAWRPNPLGQLSAEHINYYTQSIACFFLNCYSGVFKEF